VDVKTVAISLPVTGERSLTDFLEYLRKEPIDITNTSVREVLVIDRFKHSTLNHLWVGFVLSRRDQRVIPLMTVHKKLIEITAQELQEGTNKIDANFFLINEKSQKGLYQNYFGSLPFTSFANVLGHKFLSFRSIEGFKGEFRPCEIIKEDKLQDWLERVETIQRIVYEYELVKERVTTWETLRTTATSETVSLVFRKWKNVNWKSFKSTIVRAVEDNNFKKFLIKAKTEDKIDKFYDLLENIQVVGMHDFNEYARALNFRGEDLVGSLEESKNVKNLVGLYLQGHIRRIVDAKKQD
jgi:hypothetical protein